MMTHGLANPKCFFVCVCVCVCVNLAQSLDRPRAPRDVTDIMRSVYKNSLEVQAIRPQVPISFGGTVHLTANSLKVAKVVLIKLISLSSSQILHPDEAAGIKHRVHNGPRLVPGTLSPETLFI
jgi:hypothetical protein